MATICTPWPPVHFHTSSWTADQLECIYIIPLVPPTFPINFWRVPVVPMCYNHPWNVNIETHEKEEDIEAHFYTREWEPVTSMDTSSTLVGGKRRAGPSSLLPTTLEGPTEYYVNTRWMGCLHGFLPTWHQMDHVSWSLGLFLKTTSWK